MTDILTSLQEFAQRPEAKDALIGAGIGAGGGALAAALSGGGAGEYIRNALIGAGVGGTAGYFGGGQIRKQIDRFGQQEPEPGPTAATVQNKPKKMSLPVAAAAGAVPLGIGSAIHGYKTDGAGAAAAHGGSALGGMLAGGVAGGMLSKARPVMGASVGGMAGGSIAALIAALVRNQRQKQAGNLTDKLQGHLNNWEPFSTTGGAAVGGMAGAGLGGLTGLVGGVLDGEDDNLASILRKVLTSAGVGGLGGAALGAGASTLGRKRLASKMEERRGVPRGIGEEIIRRTSFPVPGTGAKGRTVGEANDAEAAIRMLSRGLPQTRLG